MKLFITGGTGFVGTSLSRYFLEQGHTVLAAGTSSSHVLEGRAKFTYVCADTTQKGKWQDALETVDAVINLAGRTIFKRWTHKYKSQIYNSRILTTRNIVSALPAEKETIFLSASAAGYYGDRAEDGLGEKDPPGTDFLAGVCVDWEGEALKARDKGMRVAAMRFGVVLGKGGGALGTMIPQFKWFAGGPLGGGRQWFPWIQMTDLISAVNFLLETPAIKGPVNFCAPGAVRQGEFAQALGKALGRPSFVPAPGFMVQLMMGELGKSFLNSQKAIPEKLIENGFVFQYPDIQNALGNIVT